MDFAELWPPYLESTIFLIVEDTCLVNKQAIWYSFKAKKAAQQVGLVYESNERCTGCFKIRPYFLRTLNIYRRANHFDPLGFVFAVKFLPYRQLITAGSPGRPHKKNHPFPSEIG